MTTEEASNALQDFIKSNLPAEYVYITVVATEGQPGHANYNCEDDMAVEILIATAKKFTQQMVAH